MTLALSVRQPLAWAILHAGMDVINRDWPTSHRGRVLIHAAPIMKQEDLISFLQACADPGHWLCGAIDAAGGLPRKDDLPKGGIVGEAEIVDCVASHPSPWFSGPHGFVLRDVKPLPFRPCQGSMRFFDVDERLLA